MTRRPLSPGFSFDFRKVTLNSAKDSRFFNTVFRQ
jgi:hypothetical protein